jgi:hypothetical protein
VSFGRSLLAIVGGPLLMSLVVRSLGLTLVNAVAGAPITSMEQYFAIRNRPGILVAELVYTTLAAVLAGYVTAKIATTDQIKYAAGAAALQTMIFIYGFTAGDAAAFTPLWMRIALVVLVGPAMLFGASIRIRAAGVEH